LYQTDISIQPHFLPRKTSQDASPL
jgi:hypothetical protein